MTLKGVPLLLIIAVSVTGLIKAESGTTERASEPANALTSTTETIEIHTTYGDFGSRRPSEVIAGETLYFAISISNLAVTPQGYASFPLQVDFLDAVGRVARQVLRENASHLLWLGGTTAIICLDWPVPRDLPSGTYYIRVKLFDHHDGERAEQRVAVNVKPSNTFGAVNFRLTYDPKGDCPARGGVFGVGSKAHIAFETVGFESQNDRVSVQAKAIAVDANAQIVSMHPLHRDSDQVLKTLAEREAVKLKTAGIPWTFAIPLSRPGNFRIRVEIKDKIGGKSAVYEVPIVVVPSA